MIGLLIIASTLLTRGVNNIQEAAVLVGAPPLALANYTYHYLEDINFNYTDFAQTLLSKPMNMFSTDFWVSAGQLAVMRNTTEYWMRTIPAMATRMPSQLYERMLPQQPKATTQLDLGMVFVGMYLMTLFTMAAAIWLLSPGSKNQRSYEDLDSDNILVRKRKRSQMPMNFYDSNRMLLRSETSEDDVFYKLD